MDKEQKKRAHAALSKIAEALKEVEDLFPLLQEAREQGEKRRGLQTVKTLKRVRGIITNFNEDNAETKLRRLQEFLGNVVLNAQKKDETVE